MSKLPPKPKRKLCNFELSDDALAALSRIQTDRLWTKTLAVEQSLIAYAAGTVPGLAATGLENARRVIPASATRRPALAPRGKVSR